MVFNDDGRAANDAQTAADMTCPPLMVEATTVPSRLAPTGRSETTGTLVANRSEAGIAARVLVVEDNPAAREMLIRILRKRGYEVDGAADASVAANLLEHQHIDLVITDLGMPGDSGLDLIEGLSDRTPYIATILVTGSGSTQVASQALASGAYGYLTKPFLQDEVYIAVLNALRRQELELQSLRNRELLEQTVRWRTMELAESLAELQSAQQELKDKAERIQALDAMKTQFVQVVSHELRTPLTVIKGGVGTVLRHGQRMEPAVQAELLSSVYSNAERLGRMIKKLLVAGAIGQGGIEHRGAPFRLDEVTAEAISEAVPDPSPRVTVRLTETTAVGDHSLIREAIRDLVENALLHTEGQVTVVTCQGVSEAVLTVTDEGPAPSQELFSRLFTEPFVQADSSITRVAGGLGLSLYLAKRIVEASAGRLTVETGRTGSSFSITLPTQMAPVSTTLESQQGGSER